MRTVSFPRRLVLMSRRSLSSSPSRHIKRPRLEGLTPDDYKNGLVLAPMVRSGARMSLRLSAFPVLISVSLVPTRLFALKHGAKLVWGPEMVDKAMLNSERVVDRASSSPRLFVWPWFEITVYKLYQGQFPTTGSRNAPYLLVIPSRSRTSSFKLALPIPILLCKQRAWSWTMSPASS